MWDGVLRLLLTKGKITPKRHSPPLFLGGQDFGDDLHRDCLHKFLHGSNPYDSMLTGRVLLVYPYMFEGSLWAYEAKKLQNCSMYVHVDMPIVPKDKFTVSVTKGRMMVTGEASAVSHDSGGWFYHGDMAMLDNPTIANNDVVCLTIPPV